MVVRLTEKERQLREITERQWSADVIKIARHCGWDGYHTHRSERSPRGFPDWTLWRTGETIFVELKTMLGKLTPEQEKVIAGLRAGGSRVYVWRPSDLDEVVAVLNARSVTR